MLAITLLALFEESGGDTETNQTLLWGSLTLSLLSLTYGIFAYQTLPKNDLVSKTNRLPHFLALLVQNSWFLAACFTSGTVFSGGNTTWALVVCLAMTYVLLGGAGCLMQSRIVFFFDKGFRDEFWHYKYWRVLFVITGFFLMASVFGVVGLVMDYPMEKATRIDSRMANMIGSFGFKQPLLAMVAIVSLHESNWPLQRSVMIAALAPLALIASVFLFFQVGYAATLKDYPTYTRNRRKVHPDGGTENEDDEPELDFRQIMMLKRMINRMKPEDPFGKQRLAWALASESNQTVLEKTLMGHKSEELHGLFTSVTGKARSEAPANMAELVHQIMSEQLRLKLRDMLEAIVNTHVYREDQAGGAHTAAQGGAREEYVIALQELQTACKQAMDTLESLDEAQRIALSARIQEYVPAPDGDGTAEAELRKFLGEGNYETATNVGGQWIPEGSERLRETRYGADGYAPGARVRHVSRGEGKVIENMSDGRVQIRFDSGGEHRYAP